MTQTILAEVVDHVAHVRLNRPQKRNALNLALMDSLADIACSLSQNKDVRAVVLSGEGEAFCAGLDLECFDLTDEFLHPFVHGSTQYPNRYQRPALLWKKVPVPVICAIQGAAFGGGLQIALGADIRIAHPDSKLSLLEIKWGLIPDMGISQTLRQLVRQDVAKDLVFSGRIVDGNEGQSLGLVTHVDKFPILAANAMARRIASCNPDAVSSAKYLLDDAWEKDQAESLKLEELLQGQIIGSANQLEAVAAQKDKRCPNFYPRNYRDLPALLSALESE